MHFLTIALLLLDFCAAVLDCAWLILALHDTCWPIIFLLRSLLVHIFESFSARIPLPLPATPPNTEPPGQKILFRPSFSLHNLTWIILRNNLALLPSTNRALLAPYMRGNRFAALAESLLANDPAPILAKHGIKLPSHELRRIERLKSLPEIVLTLPEDGNRKPQRDEKGGRKLRMKAGFLGVPRRVGKAGKVAREKRKEGERRIAREREGRSA